MKWQYVPIIILAMAQVVRAQDPIPKDSVTQLAEIILIDSISNKRKAWGITPSRKVIARDMQNYGPVDFTGPLNQVSGIFMSSGALNTNRIAIRGIGARTPYGTDKLMLYYNEIPVTNGTGISTIEAFDLENIGALEVIKGPKGTEYGAALGGTLVLEPERQRGLGTRITEHFSLGSYGLFKNLLGISHTGEKVSLNLKYGRLETDGYRENSRFERNGLLLDLGLPLGPSTLVSLVVNHIDYTAQIPSSLGLTAFHENPRQAAPTWQAAQGYENNDITIVGLGVTQRLGTYIKNTTTLFYNYQDHYEPRPFNILDSYTNSYGARTKFEGSQDKPFGAMQYVVGAEFFGDEYHWGLFENRYRENDGNGSLQGERLGDNLEFRRRYNIFGSITYPLSHKFNAQLGLALHNTHYDYRDHFLLGAENRSASRKFGTIVLPNLTLEYIPIAPIKLYANISRGYSDPGLEETLTPDGAINPDIGREKGMNYEFGGLASFPKIGLDIDLALYQMDIHDLLVAQRVGEDQYIGRNAGKTRHQGIDLDLRYSVPRLGRFSLSPFLSYTFSKHRFKDFVDGGNDYSGNPVTGVPPNRLVGGIQLRENAGVYWNVTMKYVDAVPLTDADTVHSDAYTLVDTRIGYAKTFFGQFETDITFGINNLGDRLYARSFVINAIGFGGSEPRYYYPGNGRNYYFGLHLRYRFAQSPPTQAL